MKYTKNNLRVSYITPEVDVCSVMVESGFFVSQNPELTYGEEGAAGAIVNGNSYEL